MNDLRRAYEGRRIFVTGHTGFKGAWLTVWLRQLNAEVSGYALAPETGSMFEQLALAGDCRSTIDDVRDFDRLLRAIDEARPDFVFHLAAQALVLESYRDPLGTITTNVTGTAHVLEALRRLGRPATVVIVTSDKCYENRESGEAYREEDAMGGRDIYSMSKGAAELVVSAYRRSFLTASAIRVASARAGNVIGGGDWADNRIVPDAMRSLIEGRPIDVRNPAAIRPWQHVLEPVGAYLTLAARLATDAQFAEAWNLGPDPDDVRTVGELVTRVVEEWGSGSWRPSPVEAAPHQAKTLRLNIDKARTRLGWKPRWTFERAVSETVHWYKTASSHAESASLRRVTDEQIARYVAE